jgi:hypothetical protein
VEVGRFRGLAGGASRTCVMRIRARVGRIVLRLCGVVSGRMAGATQDNRQGHEEGYRRGHQPRRRRACMEVLHSTGGEVGRGRMLTGQTTGRGKSRELGSRADAKRRLYLQGEFPTLDLHVRTNTDRQERQVSTRRAAQHRCRAGRGSSGGEQMAISDGSMEEVELLRRQRPCMRLRTGHSSSLEPQMRSGRRTIVLNRPDLPLSCSPPAARSVIETEGTNTSSTNRVSESRSMYSARS